MTEDTTSFGIAELCKSLALLNAPNTGTTPVSRIHDELLQEAILLLSSPGGVNQLQKDAIETVCGPILAIDGHRRRILDLLHYESASRATIRKWFTDLIKQMEKTCEYMHAHQPWEGVRTAQFAAGVVLFSLEYVLCDLKDEFVKDLLIDAQTGHAQAFLRLVMQVTKCDEEVLEPFPKELQRIETYLSTIEQSCLDKDIEAIGEARSKIIKKIIPPEIQ